MRQIGIACVRIAPPSVLRQAQDEASTSSG